MQTLIVQFDQIAKKVLRFRSRYFRTDKSNMSGIQLHSSTHIGADDDSYLVEAAVGIIQFTNNAPGFLGIHKQRFSDFIVKEVSLFDEIASLKTINGDEIENLYFQQSIGNAQKTETIVYPEEVLDKLKLDLENLIADIDQNSIAESDKSNNISFKHINNELFQLLSLFITKSIDCPDSVNAFPCTNKRIRTKLHEIFRHHMSKYVDTDTVVLEGIQHIRLLPKHKHSNKESCYDNQRPVKRAFWPSNLGDYLQFTLLKENVDTMSACNIISKALHLKLNSISFAGTKDKRGVTLQRCAVYRKKPSDFRRLNQSSFSPFIRVGDFSYCHEPLKLGGLKGNQFVITLRSVDRAIAEVDAACFALKQSGFINYFGLQRFGKGGASSDRIGMVLLKSDYKTAIDLLFAPRGGDREEIQSTKQFFRNRDYRAARECIPFQMNAEKLVLEHLINRPSDYAGAINRIPKSVRLLTIHAVQSYLFNMSASLRVKRYGLQVVAGDLVALNMLEVEQLQSEIEVQDAELAEQGQGDTDAVESIKLDTVSTENKFNRNVHVVTEEDVASNRFSIDDVILPLIGSNIILPSNSIGEYMIELLRKEGLSMEIFATCSTIHYRSRGQYRKLIQKPIDFEYRFKSYTSIDEEIIETEISKYRQKSSSLMCSTITPMNSEFSVDTPLQQFKALILQFILPSGTYATMMLRELTKRSTETLYQASLTAQTMISDNLSKYGGQTIAVTEGFTGKKRCYQEME